MAGRPRNGGSNSPELKNSVQDVNWSYYLVKNSQRYQRTLKGNTSLEGNIKFSLLYWKE